MHGFDPVYGVTHYRTSAWSDKPFLIYEVPVQAKTGVVLWDNGRFPVSQHGSLEEVELVLAVKYQKKLGEKRFDGETITSWKTEDL